MPDNTARVIAFKQRLLVSRAPFPDLTFDIGETVREGDRVALSWAMRGRNSAAWVDLRLSVAQQLGLLG
jgi:predicted ester cyclase